ncbi:MAG: hypothetical protein WCD35_09890 [Mycobacteriales bacterium]
MPPAVRELGLPERRLAWGLTPEGEALVATSSGLHAGGEVLAWTLVEKVVWRPPLLTLTEVAEVEGSGRVREWTLEQDASLAEVVRARVTSSVGWSDRRALAPSGAVRLVGRRVPGQDALLWQAVYEQGTDVDDPQVRGQVATMVEELRRTIG